MHGMKSDPNPGPILAKIGAWLQVSQIIGFGLAFSAMSKAAPANPNAADTTVAPEVLSAAMGQAIQYLLIGIGVSVLGIMMIIMSAVIFRYRAAWFFRFLCIYGGAMILSHMMPLGIFLLIFAILKRNEFEKDPDFGTTKA